MQKKNETDSEFQYLAKMTLYETDLGNETEFGILPKMVIYRPDSFKELELSRVYGILWVVRSWGCM